MCPHLFMINRWFACSPSLGKTESEEYLSEKNWTALLSSLNYYTDNNLIIIIWDHFSCSLVSLALVSPNSRWLVWFHGKTENKNLGRLLNRHTGTNGPDRTCLRDWQSLQKTKPKHSLCFFWHFGLSLFRFYRKANSTHTLNIWELN